MAIQITKTNNVVEIDYGTSKKEYIPNTTNISVTGHTDGAGLNSIYIRSQGNIRLPFDSISMINGAARPATLEATVNLLTEQVFDNARLQVSTEQKPSAAAVAIVPSNTVNISAPTRGIYVGVSGDVTAVVGGTAILFTSVPPGMILPVVATRVNATGTTATGLIALF